MELCWQESPMEKASRDKGAEKGNIIIGRFYIRQRKKRMTYFREVERDILRERERGLAGDGDTRQV